MHFDCNGHLEYIFTIPFLYKCLITVWDRFFSIFFCSIEFVTCSYCLALFIPLLWFPYGPFVISPSYPVVFTLKYPFSNHSPQITEVVIRMALYIEFFRFEFHGQRSHISPIMNERIKAKWPDNFVTGRELQYL